MQMKSKRLLGRCVCALLASNTSLAFAQSSAVSNSILVAPDENAETGVLREVVVVGVRASLASAQDIKRDKLEIVDSIVADDITKLPDFSVTDALQRVTGLQIARDRGDGTGITIRGLTQMETTLNGREMFTAGAGRNLDFADMASEMVAGIDVYKTSSAEHIEGGVGGLIDLRTRRPFDFKGREIVGSTRLVYGDLVDRNAAQFSTLASNRWKTATAGEFGALVNFAYQDRAFREDQKSTGNPLARFLNVVAEIIGVRARQKHIMFACEFAQNLPEGIRGDERRLRQVLLNLLSNAVKFTDQGKVTLSVSRASPSRLAFAVKDTGIGIEPEVLHTVFADMQRIEVGGAEESAEPLVAPPKEEIEELRRLALHGNMRDIVNYAERIDSLDPCYRPFAEYLKGLANGYRSKAILAFVEARLT